MSFLSLFSYIPIHSSSSQCCEYAYLSCQSYIQLMPYENLESYQRLPRIFTVLKTDLCPQIKEIKVRSYYF